MAGAGQHSAKGTKQHSIVRSAKNKRTGKYDRQRHRTEARKDRVKARSTAKLRRMDIRCQQDADEHAAGIATGAARRRIQKRATRERLRKMNSKDRARARERGQRQFARGEA